MSLTHMSAVLLVANIVMLLLLVGGNIQAKNGVVFLMRASVMVNAIQQKKMPLVQIACEQEQFTFLANQESELLFKQVVGKKTVWIIIVVTLLIIGGLIFYLSSRSKSKIGTTVLTTSTQTVTQSTPPSSR